VIFSPLQFVPVIGASGAIYGLLLAFGWLFPNRLIYIYFLFPIPAKYFVIIFGLIELFASMAGTGGGIAHLTHLGGILFGLFYMGYPISGKKFGASIINASGLKKAPVPVVEAIIINPTRPMYRIQGVKCSRGRVKILKEKHSNSRALESSNPF
jgi:hypothetical protein